MKTSFRTKSGPKVAPSERIIVPSTAPRDPKILYQRSPDSRRISYLRKTWAYGDDSPSSICRRQNFACGT
ncbi:hypothetical protein PROFUN_04673 [Planoprotostelium fungivorum]|uniref:Uncharacterized protein n=1 Tax=Planoprotostelium fungivorum TaxID=1890364 RepID=A0A2P6NUN9_9EUKA|nr:hypothetical protein PROFUN_04673 [Planoprotostelium fungivorum]